MCRYMYLFFFFFNDTATTEIYTLSLHDALPILQDELGLSYVFISHDMSVIRYMCDRVAVMYRVKIVEVGGTDQVVNNPRSEEHTSELQSRQYLVCRLLLEKKKYL